ncbi:MAG: PDGLE domain-containing protein [bacterium]|nr:PDGLE domain-containing protein [bacterium]
MKKIIFTGLIISFFLVLFISPFASSSPDGLERVAINKEFIEKGEGHNVIKSPMPDYLIPGIKQEKVSTSVAGLIGVLIVFGIAYGASAIFRKKREE